MSDSDGRSIRWDIVKWLTIVSLTVGIIAGLWKLYDEYLKPPPPPCACST